MMTHYFLTTALFLTYATVQSSDKKRVIREFGRFTITMSEKPMSKNNHRHEVLAKEKEVIEAAMILAYFSKSNEIPHLAASYGKVTEPPVIRNMYQ